MTTNQLRRQAEDAAKALRWAEAAELMQDAIDAYPTKGAMADLDKSRMANRAEGWRLAAKFRDVAAKLQSDPSSPFVIALQQGAEIGRILGESTESECRRARAVTDWLRSTRR